MSYQIFKQTALKVTAATLVLASIVTPSLAGNLWIEPTYVSRIEIDASGIAYIRVDPASIASGTAPAACSTNGYWQFVFNATTPAGQAMLSIATSAKLSRSSIRIFSTGACNVYSSIETVQNIGFLP